MTDSGLKRRIQSGKLKRALPTVYMVSGAPQTWRSNLMAACLWAGDEAAASFRAAAALWGFDDYPSAPLEISTTCKRRPHGLPILVHRMDQWLVSDIVAVGGITVTSVRRTLLDLAGCGDRRVERALDQSLLRSLTSLADLWLLYDQEWTHGRRGIARLRAMLVERTPDLAPTRSELEARMRDLIRTQDLPRPRYEYPVQLSTALVHLDVAYPDDRLAIELDGYSWHSDRESFERDRERDNELQGLDWTVLRFTWAKLRWEPGRVVDSIRRNLTPSRPSGW